MSNKFFSTYNRLDLYFTYIPYVNDYNQEDDISILWFTENFNIPVSVIRNDFVAILSSYNYAENTVCAIYPRDTEEISVKEAINSIKKGDWDSFPLISSIPFNKEHHSLSLSEEELKAIIDEFRINEFNNHIIDFEIKKDYRYYPAENDLYDTLKDINEAIDQKLQIFFYYRSTEDIKYSHIITPIKIIYDNEENLYHVLGLKNNKFETYDIRLIKPSSVLLVPEDVPLLDQTVSSKYSTKVHILNIPSEKYDENHLQELIPHVWKNSFQQKKPTHVKVKFPAEVYETVSTDLVFRNPEKTLSKIVDGYFYFEDDIYGTDAFDRWIRGFGSKAIIIEPKKMAQHRIAMLKEMLELYKINDL